MLCSFRLVILGKIGEKIPESSRLEFLEKFLANKTSGLLSREGIVDLPLLRILLAICPKSQEPSFWEKMDSFVLLLSYASLAAFATITCLSVLYFRFRRFILLVQSKKSDF